MRRKARPGGIFKIVRLRQAVWGGVADGFVRIQIPRSIVRPRRPKSSPLGKSSLERNPKTDDCSLRFQAHQNLLTQAPNDNLIAVSGLCGATRRRSSTLTASPLGKAPKMTTKETRRAPRARCKPTTKNLSPTPGTAMVAGSRARGRSSTSRLPFCAIKLPAS